MRPRGMMPHDHGPWDIVVRVGPDALGTLGRLYYWDLAKADALWDIGQRDAAARRWKARAGVGVHRERERGQRGTIESVALRFVAAGAQPEGRVTDSRESAFRHALRIWRS